MTRALVPLADGTEEMEATIIIDVLRRAGWQVVAAGVTGTTIEASRGVRLLADEDWHAVDPSDFDVLVIPGGAAGTEALSGNESLLETIRCFAESNRLVAAVCAGPLVLQAAGVVAGKRITCHPGVADQLTDTARVDERVVVDGRIITSQGPGTAMEFALAIIAAIDGPEAAKAVRPGLILPNGGEEHA